MTNINFYVSKNEGWEHRLAIVSRLVGIATQRKLSIHIHTNNEKDSKHIDNFLWQQPATSFLPHKCVQADEVESNLLPNEISIGHEFAPLKNCDYLINLSIERPEYFSRYLKVAEIIDSSEEILTAGRKRYAFYKDRGYTLEYHQL